MKRSEYENILATQRAVMSLTVSMIPAPVSVTQKRGMNKWEAEYAAGLEALRRVGDNDWYQFEAMKFRLAAGAYYTPDFIVLRNGKLEAHEVKGHWREAALVRFKVAADRHPGVTFMAFSKRKVREGGGWERIR